MQLLELGTVFPALTVFNKELLLSLCSHHNDGDGLHLVPEWKALSIPPPRVHAVSKHGYFPLASSL